MEIKMTPDFRSALKKAAKKNDVGLIGKLILDGRYCGDKNGVDIFNMFHSREETLSWFHEETGISLITLDRCIPSRMTPTGKSNAEIRQSRKDFMDEHEKAMTEESLSKTPEPKKEVTMNQSMHTATIIGLVESLRIRCFNAMKNGLHDDKTYKDFIQEQYDLMWKEIIDGLGGKEGDGVNITYECYKKGQ